MGAVAAGGHRGGNGLEALELEGRRGMLYMIESSACRCMLAATKRCYMKLLISLTREALPFSFSNNMDPIQIQPFLSS
jgi:hypothetical protein